MQIMGREKSQIHVNTVNIVWPAVNMGRTIATAQRWYCTNCHASFFSKNNHQLKEFNTFQKWLFVKNVHKEMVIHF